MNIHLHQGDIPSGLLNNPMVAVDTEAMGLKPWRDRLCLVQLSEGDGSVHLVHLQPGECSRAENLKQILTNPQITKIFHFARFDIATLYQHLGILTQPAYCTKIASRLARTYSDKHSLKDLCKELLGVEVSKHEQTSDWGQPTLTKEQMRYAATDVLHLHRLKQKLDEILHREGRAELANACFQFVPYRALWDLLAGEEHDIFKH
jgi:ribonuclease D